MSTFRGLPPVRLEMEAATVIQAEGELTVAEKPATSAVVWVEDQLAVGKTLAISKTQRTDSSNISREGCLGGFDLGHPIFQNVYGSIEENIGGLGIHHRERCH